MYEITKRSALAFRGSHFGRSGRMDRHRPGGIRSPGIPGDPVSSGRGCLDIRFDDRDPVP